eukprot:1156920-Pelagomonas_calceolata.AAC.4
MMWCKCKITPFTKAGANEPLSHTDTTICRVLASWMPRTQKNTLMLRALSDACKRHRKHTVAAEGVLLWGRLACGGAKSHPSCICCPCQTFNVQESLQHRHSLIAPAPAFTGSKHNSSAIRYTLRACSKRTATSAHARAHTHTHTHTHTPCPAIPPSAGVLGCAPLRLRFSPPRTHAAALASAQRPALRPTQGALCPHPPPSAPQDSPANAMVQGNEPSIITVQCFAVHANEGSMLKLLGPKCYIGLTFHYKLKHMVKDRINYRSTGEVVQVTNEPTHGKGNDGDRLVRCLLNICLIIYRPYQGTVKDQRHVKLHLIG